MLLALDVGNTNTVFGLHDGEEWVGRWRTRTESAATMDECAVSVASALNVAGFQLDQITDLALASVVPRLTATIHAFGRHYLDTEPLIVGAESAGIEVGYANPQTLGADRIANAVAAYELYGRAVIVVDFGTATTFDYVSPGGKFEGGIIAPGLMVTGEALFAKTAQLPQVDMLKKVDGVLSRDTISAMTVGLFEGYLSLIEGLLSKLKAEVGTDPEVVATGGLAGAIAARCPSLTEVQPNLTLEGIRLILEKNRGRRRGGGG